MKILAPTTAALLLLLAGCTDDAAPTGAGGAKGSHSSAHGSGTGGAGGAGGGAAGSTGTAGSAAESCDPYEPRAVAPELVIGPTGMQAAFLQHIDAATSTLDVMMYELGVAAFTDAFIAAKQRGVAVRLLFDADQSGNNSPTAKLSAAGVEVKPAPAEFENAHAKVLLIDGKEAIISSGNLNGYSMSSERNYAVVDTAWDDLADLAAIFERDWSGAPLDLSCTRLVVSPENSRERLVAHMSGAKQSLDLASMYVSDGDALATIKGRAAAGVPVRVLLASPGWISDNAATAKELEAAGVQARFLTKFELHAKLIVADGIPFVGSENLSWTSLGKNREVGVFVTEDTPAAAIRDQFEQDWAAGVE